MTVDRQEHHGGFEIAALGTKSGVASCRKHHVATSTCVHSVTYYFILVVGCFSAQQLRR